MFCFRCKLFKRRNKVNVRVSVSVYCSKGGLLPRIHIDCYYSKRDLYPRIRINYCNRFSENVGNRVNCFGNRENSDFKIKTGKLFRKPGNFFFSFFFSVFFFYYSLFSVLSLGSPSSFPALVPCLRPVSSFPVFASDRPHRGCNVRHGGCESQHSTHVSQHHSYAACMEDIKAHTTPETAHIEAAKSHKEDATCHIAPVHHM